jgi:hypothetical protein
LCLLVCPSFPLLHESQVIRAKACGIGKRCHFETKTGVGTHTDLMEYEDDPAKPTLAEKQIHHKTADSEIDMTVEFDVFETDAVGCTPGIIVFKLEVTKVHRDKIQASEVNIFQDF